MYINTYNSFPEVGSIAYIRLSCMSIFTSSIKTPRASPMFRLRSDISFCGAAPVLCPVTTAVVASSRDRRIRSREHIVNRSFVAFQNKLQAWVVLWIKKKFRTSSRRRSTWQKVASFFLCVAFFRLIRRSSWKELSRYWKLDFLQTCKS